MGTGLSGAVSGMAGRGAELTLDAMGGHAQGSFEDNLLSVVAAGGRGFVENVGHGIAEVPKARRDAAEAQYNGVPSSKVRQKRLARARPVRWTKSDAAFRMEALRTARRIDPKINPKEFLANLDAAVAADRAGAAASRELARKFRTEALAGIPPARRGEFANTPIRVLPDTEFERAHGQQVRPGRHAHHRRRGPHRRAQERRPGDAARGGHPCPAIARPEVAGKDRAARRDDDVALERARPRDAAQAVQRQDRDRDRCASSVCGAIWWKTPSARRIRASQAAARACAEEADQTLKSLQARQQEVAEIGPGACCRRSFR